MKKACIVCSIVLLVSSVILHGGCKKKELYQEGKRINLPNEFLGIDFCTLTAKEIIEKHEKAGAPYKIIDLDKNEEIKFDGDYEKLEISMAIISKYFIGKGIDQNKIIRVYYGYIPIYDSIDITIDLKEEYYHTVLEQLKKQFGFENAYVRMNTEEGYGVVEWSSERGHCIDCITISNESEENNKKVKRKGSFSLEIRMHPRIEDHVH